MTEFDRNAPSGTPPGTAPSVSPGSAKPAATPAVKLEHEQDRFSRWTTAQDRDSSAGRRRLYVIAGIIVLGLIIWLVWTR